MEPDLCELLVALNHLINYHESLLHMILLSLKSVWKGGRADCGNLSKVLPCCFSTLCVRKSNLNGFLLIFFLCENSSVEPFLEEFSILLSSEDS